VLQALLLTLASNLSKKVRCGRKCYAIPFLCAKLRIL
jgi:hypothetical protein